MSYYNGYSSYGRGNNRTYGEKPNYHGYSNYDLERVQQGLRLGMVEPGTPAGYSRSDMLRDIEAVQYYRREIKRWPGW